MLQRVIKAVPSRTMTQGKHDPWLHFYEDFLQEYDPKLRKDAGAYYTPLEVVHTQTVLVDEILRKKLNKPMGFAEGGVITLDPAVGTGTYLLSIIDYAMKRVEIEEGIGAVKGRASLLAQSLYGFEIMVGPYAVAALRMTRLLHDYGGGIPGDGVQIFLNNTLESPYEIIPELPMMYRAIGLEHQRAKRVKESVPVLVCIGNPPYDRHEAANASNKMTTGAWVRWGETKNHDDAILNDFIKPVKDAGKGGQLKNLYNQYVYFWRWGLWKVFEQPFAQTGGIVSFITASSFMDGDAFIGMRRKMRELCDEIWIIDLGGDGRGTRQDDNVFAIQTPVAIMIAMRYNQPNHSQAAKINYSRIEGSKAEKLTKLQKISSLDDLTFEECSHDWSASFIPTISSQYFDWPTLNNLMPWQHSGVEAKRTWPIGPTEGILNQCWKELLLASDRAIYFKESSDRLITGKYKSLWGNSNETIPLSDLHQNTPCPVVHRFGYRSFDRQYVIADNRLIARSREPLWASFSEKQIYFSTLTSNPISKGPALTVSAYVPDRHYYRGSYGAKDIIPLYRDSRSTLPNIHPDLLIKLYTIFGQNVTAEDFVCYVYAILANPSFTNKFQNELATKVLHLPISLDFDLFQQAVVIGERLIWLQTYGERFSDKFNKLSGHAKCVKAVQSALPVEKYHYNEAKQLLIVGDGEFGPIAPAIWNFEVSGLKVLQSWLDYRMVSRSGKKSSPLDMIELMEWTSELTSELLRLLWILEHSLLLYPEQELLLAKILDGELLSKNDLNNASDLFRAPPKKNAEQEDLDLG